MNRRKFLSIAEDYGNPDWELRDYHVPGSPLSGAYRPIRADVDKWLARLGLPDTYAMQLKGAMQKGELRNHCRMWLADNSHRCEVEDICLIWLSPRIHAPA